ncbi:MAG: PAS domain-containing protein [Sulfuritalea sp.]|nr:PAS domain-containing protein [Sulfuritalea sp.]
MNQVSEYQLVFERASIGIVVLRDSVIQHCNRRFEELLGHSPGALTGQSTRVLFPSEQAWVENASSLPRQSPNRAASKTI